MGREGVPRPKAEAKSAIHGMLEVFITLVAVRVSFIQLWLSFWLYIFKAEGEDLRQKTFKMQWQKKLTTES